jgi:hypothetical protein
MGAEVAQLVPGVTGEQQCGGPQDGGLGVQLLREATQGKGRVGDVLDDRRAVDDEQRGPGLSHHMTDGSADRVQPLLQGIKEIEVDHSLTDERGVEEGEAGQVGQH